MSEKKGVRIEVWPVGADELGIWSIAGDYPWGVPGPELRADDDEHFHVEMVLAQHAARDRALLIHSTSWRPVPPSIMLTYFAVIDVQTLVRTEWPGARPITLDVFDAIGKPEPHGPADPPRPTTLDVFRQGLRELLDLHDRDDIVGAPLRQGYWTKYLGTLRPSLVEMYRRSA